jgi:NAD(P)-dependent dehydrogenase (short-subunit alcohol dehydrogenase family)
MAKDNYVLITGASTGIGFACAKLLDKNGWHVYAGYRKAEDGQRLQEAGTKRLIPIRLDVTNQEDIDNVVRHFQDTLPGGRLDALINNAGIAVAGPLEFLPLEDWRRQFEVNVMAQVAVTQAMIPFLRQARGRVLMMGSVSGVLALPMMGPYSGSKFALEGIADALRVELSPWEIEVVLIQPGAIVTPIWQKGRNWAEEMEAKMPEEARELYKKFIQRAKDMTHYAEKTGVPPEAVAMVCWRALTSRKPRARYLVGKNARSQKTLARWVPEGLRDKLIRKQMKL